MSKKQRGWRKSWDRRQDMGYYIYTRFVYLLIYSRYFGGFVMYLLFDFENFGFFQVGSIDAQKMFVLFKV